MRRFKPLQAGAAEEAPEAAEAVEIIFGECGSGRLHGKLSLTF
jgi:hypothetical protein